MIHINLVKTYFFKRKSNGSENTSAFKLSQQINKVLLLKVQNRNFRKFIKITNIYKLCTNS